MRTPIRRRVDWKFVGFLLAAVAIAVPRTASADDCIPDDVIIDGSLNVGFDSVCNRNFGFDTIVLSENNLRIFFEDTSNSASFPDNDWRILINATSNGGDEFFAVEDTSAGRIPFTIQAGARSNSLFIRNGGDIGFGTANPVVNLHIVDGNTPTVRLDQDGSQGFTPQVWDIAGNEANFFIRDVTNGSKLPFRITPNTPTSTIRMFTDKIVLNDGGGNYDTQIKGDTQNNLFYVDASTDRVGIGTATPVNKLDLESGDFSIDKGFRIKWDGTTNENSLRFSNSNTPDFRILLDGTDRLAVTTTGRVGIGNNAPGFPLQVGTGVTNGNGAHVTVGGVWTNGSSRDFKENIKEVAIAEARDAVMNLKPVTYNYKLEPGEQYAGFIAEDVPELVATTSRKYLSPMDIVSVVAKVVQDQQLSIERQQETISTLSKRLDQLEGRSLAQD